MNKIESLIQQLCPDGVEYKELEVLLEKKIVKTIIPPKKLTKEFYNVNGIFPIVDQGQDFIVGYTDDKDIVIEKGLYVVFGDHTEAIKYVDFAFVQGADGIKIIVTNDEIIITKFLFYALNSFYKKVGKYSRHFSFLKKTSIPIPPLPIQQEIVNILDKFTSLEAELEAELEARRTQYEYYRNQLLTATEVNGKWLMNGKEVEWKTLGEVGEFIRGNGLQKKDFTESGVGCIHYGQIYTYYGTFTHKTKSFVLPEFAKKLKKANKGDLIIATTSENVEDVCKTVVWLGDEEIAISGETYIYKHTLNSKYVAYHLQTPMFLDFKKQNITGTKVIRVHGDKLKKFRIPIPPLQEQERIVEILDKFDALVNDISEGLPAEMEARRKQYEYYREKLLTFKPLNN